MDIEDFKSTRFNVVGVGTKLTGELRLQGMSSISGEVHGDVIGDADALLVIERSGVIQGSVRAPQVEVRGSVTGRLTVSGTLTVKAGAHVEGEISAGHLVIYPGAVVDGQCHAG